MQCPRCLNDSKFKKGIKVITSNDVVVSAPYHDEVHDYVNIGLDYNTFSQLYMDICTNCGTVVRTYIVPKKKK